MKVIYFLNRANGKTSFKRTQIVGMFLVEQDKEEKMYAELYNQISSQYENLYAYETVNSIEFLPDLKLLEEEVLNENVYFVIDIDVVDKMKFDINKIKEYLYERGIESFIQESNHGYHIILPKRADVSLLELKSLTEGYKDFDIVKAEIKTLDGTKKDGVIYKTKVFTEAK